MRMIFGVLMLVVVLAIVGKLGKTQLESLGSVSTRVRSISPPAPDGQDANDTGSRDSASSPCRAACRAPRRPARRAPWATRPSSPERFRACHQPCAAVGARPAQARRAVSGHAGAAMTPSDEFAMRLALDQAQNALAGRRGAGRRGDRRDTPNGRRCVATGYNRPITTNDPTAHAEIVALRHAAQLLGNYRLPELRALRDARALRDVRDGAHARARRSASSSRATDPKTGAAGSVVDLFGNRALNHHTDVRAACWPTPAARHAARLLRRAARSSTGAPIARRCTGRTTRRGPIRRRRVEPESTTGDTTGARRHRRPGDAAVADAVLARRRGCAARRRCAAPRAPGRRWASTSPSTRRRRCASQRFAGDDDAAPRGAPPRGRRGAVDRAWPPAAATA